MLQNCATERISPSDCRQVHLLHCENNMFPCRVGEKISKKNIIIVNLLIKYCAGMNHTSVYGCGRNGRTHILPKEIQQGRGGNPSKKAALHRGSRANIQEKEVSLIGLNFFMDS